MTEEEISRVLADMGQPAFRGKQVFTWLHRGVRSFDEMSNLSKPLRQQLAQAYTISVPTVARKQESRLDGTIKYLWELPDGNCIETVLMQYHHGNTVCISSQVGCRMGCAFCASTVAGKVRDLTAGEMLDQVLFTQLDSDREISNIVLMGIGEPLDNRENVLRFLRLVNHPDGLNIGMRHISLSTCGVVPGIDALAEEDLQLTLSVSLHAPDSETRSRIMPVNRAWDVEELFAACHRYFRRTGRRISLTAQSPLPCRPSSGTRKSLKRSAAAASRSRASPRITFSLSCRKPSPFLSFTSSGRRHAICGKTGCARRA